MSLNANDQCAAKNEESPIEMQSYIYSIYLKKKVLHPILNDSNSEDSPSDN
jgi:hypothetical protein